LKLQVCYDFANFRLGEIEKVFSNVFCTIHINRALNWD
jgi:hypothetical protein